MKYLATIAVVASCAFSSAGYAQEEDWHGKTWAPNYAKEVGASDNLSVSANSLHACMLSSIYGHRDELEYARGMNGAAAAQIAEMCRTLSEYFVFRCKEAGFAQSDCYAMVREDAEGALSKYLPD